jgi:hypothetical protein
MTNPQTTESVGGSVLNEVNTNRMDITPPNPHASQRIEHAERLKNLLPQYSPYNSIAFRGRFLTNDAFRRQFIDDVFNDASQDANFRNQFADPAAFSDAKAKFEAKITEQLARESMTGQDIKEFIIDRSIGATTQRTPVQVTSNEVPRVNGISAPGEQINREIVNTMSDYYKILLGRESGGFNVDNRGRDGKPASSATGVFQFTIGTWDDMMRRNPDLGLTKEGRRDIGQQVKAIGRFTEQNAKVLERAGIKPSDRNLRLSHFFGETGGRDFIQALQATPNAIAADNWSNKGQISANPTEFYKPDGTPRTFAEMAEKLAGNLSNETQTWREAPVAEPRRTQQQTVASDAIPSNTVATASEVNAIAKRNPGPYFEHGIVDSKGNPIYTNQNEVALQEKLRSDQALQRQVMEDRYGLFTDALAKTHNASFITESDPEQVSRAWVMFDKFGEEGLTQFVNIEQHYKAGRRDDEQDIKVRTALDFMRYARKDGMSPIQAIDNWFKNPDGSVPSFTPQMRGVETLRDYPLDTNPFTAHYHRNNDTNQFVQSLLDSTTKTDFHWTSKVANFFLGENQAPAVEFIAEEIESGLITDLTKVFFFDVLKSAQEGNNGFTVEDLVKTITANAEYSPSGNKQTWQFNYNDLPDYAKVAVNAIRMDNTVFRNAFSVDDSGLMTFEPDRATRLTQQASSFAGVMTHEVPVYDERGNYLGMEEQPRSDFVAQFVNSVPVFTYKVGQFGANYIINPTLKLTHATLSGIGAEDLASDLENSDYWRNIQDLRDARIDPLIQGFLPNATAIGVDLGGYIAGTVAIGSALASTGGAAAGAILPKLYASAAYSNRAMQLGKMAMVTERARNVSYAGAFGEKLNRGLKSKEMWTAIGRFELGASGMELIGGKDMSVFNGGAFDDLVNMASMGTLDIDTERRYMLSNRIGQFAADAGFGFGVGVVFDGVWAATKFGTNLARVPMGKQSRGLKYDPKIGNYEMVDFPQFTSDWRRFYYNATSNLDEIPMGDVTDSIRNMYAGRAIMLEGVNQATVSDVATRFYHETSEVFTNLQPELENIIRHFDTVLGAGAMTPEQISRRAQDIYRDSLEDFVANATVIMRGGPEGSNTQFMRNFADALEGQTPTVRRTGIPLEDGTTREVLKLDEAVLLRETNPNVVIKRIDGTNNYAAYEVDANYWTVPMAKRMRDMSDQLTANQAAASILRRKYKIDGEIPTEYFEEMTELASTMKRVVGRPITNKGKLGYITDMEDGFYTVRYQDGSTGKVQNIIIDDLLAGNRDLAMVGDDIFTVRGFGAKRGPSSSLNVKEMVEAAKEAELKSTSAYNDLILYHRDMAMNGTTDQRVLSRGVLRALGQSIDEPLALLPQRTADMASPLNVGRMTRRAQQSQIDTQQGRDATISYHRELAQSGSPEQRLQSRSILRGFGEEVDSPLAALPQSGSTTLDEVAEQYVGRLRAATASPVREVRDSARQNLRTLGYEVADEPFGVAQTSLFDRAALDAQNMRISAPGEGEIINRRTLTETLEKKATEIVDNVIDNSLSFAGREEGTKLLSALMGLGVSRKAAWERIADKLDNEMIDRMTRIREVEAKDYKRPGDKQRFAQKANDHFDELNRRYQEVQRMFTEAESMVAGTNVDAATKKAINAGKIRKQMVANKSNVKTNKGC